MKKTPRWKQMRLQKKREKTRLYKQVKPHRVKVEEKLWDLVVHPWDVPKVGT